MITSNTTSLPSFRFISRIRAQLERSHAEYQIALLDWPPKELEDEMRTNGARSSPQVLGDIEVNPEIAGIPNEIHYILSGYQC